MMKSGILLIAGLFLLRLDAICQAEITVIAQGLRAPVGIELAEDGSLWVAERGTGQRDGAVTVIWPDGTQERVLDSLPSLVNPVSNEVQGPFRVQIMDANYLALSLHHTSFSEYAVVCVFRRDQFVQGGGQKLLEDAVSVIRVGEYVRGPLGKADSNPYTFVHDGCDLYIADAAANTIIHRDGLTGVMSGFATFPSIQNPLPFGPPFIDAVPTRILIDPEGGFVVSQLTGFPFIDGAASIFSVDQEGNLSVLYDQLTLITDIAWSPDGDGILALQFADFVADSLPPFLFNSGLIIHLHDDQTRDTIAAGFGPSPGLAVDGEGNCYVTHLFLGLVLKIEHGVTGVREHDGSDEHALKVFPNPGHGDLTIAYEANSQGTVHIGIFDQLGRQVYAMVEDAVPGFHQRIVTAGELRQVVGFQTLIVAVSMDGRSSYDVIQYGK